MTIRPKCRHPGCTRVVAESNTSGVCQQHRHSSKCLCVQCVQSYVRVSLPKEPWEASA